MSQVKKEQEKNVFVMDGNKFCKIEVCNLVSVKVTFPVLFTVVLLELLPLNIYFHFNGLYIHGK